MVQWYIGVMVPINGQYKVHWYRTIVQWYVGIMVSINGQYKVHWYR